MAAVRILLRTRNDYLPTTQGVNLGALPGPAPGRRVPCSDCRGRRAACLVCNGTGWRLRKAGEPGWDEYTRQPVASDESNKKDVGVMSSEDLDAELAKLRNAESVRAGGSDAVGYKWERARERRDAEGSYAELERCLEMLKDPYRHVISVVYESGLVKQVRGSYADAETEAVRKLAVMMPGRVRVPRWAYPEIRELQVSWVRRLSGSVRDVARQVGRSQAFVRSVLLRP